MLHPAVFLRSESDGVVGSLDLAIFRRVSGLSIAEEVTAGAVRRLRGSFERAFQEVGQVLTCASL